MSDLIPWRMNWQEALEEAKKVNRSLVALSECLEGDRPITLELLVRPGDIEGTLVVLESHDNTMDLLPTLLRINYFRGCLFQITRLFFSKNIVMKGKKSDHGRGTALAEGSEYHESQINWLISL